MDFIHRRAVSLKYLCYLLSFTAAAKIYSQTPPFCQQQPWPLSSPQTTYRLPQSCQRYLVIVCPYCLQFYHVESIVTRHSYPVLIYDIRRGYALKREIHRSLKSVRFPSAIDKQFAIRHR